MKKYVVESWFRIENICDTKEEAEEQAKIYIEYPYYKDTRVIELIEPNNKSYEIDYAN